MARYAMPFPKTSASDRPAAHDRFREPDEAPGLAAALWSGEVMPEDLADIEAAEEYRAVFARQAADAAADGGDAYGPDLYGQAAWDDRA